MVLLLLYAPLEQAFARKYSALVMDAATGEVLHSRRANDYRYPASITKVMTLYMLFDAIKQGHFDMDSRLKVSRKAAQASPSKLGLGRGTFIKVKDAIGTLITKSANDVAIVVAEALADSEKEFAKKMTRKARSIGMKRTTFRNASGLYHREQITTAHDVAVLAQKVRKNFPEFYPLFKMRSYTFRGRKYRNHNKLLDKYPGVEGMKTGFINASGFNLVAVAKRNNQRVITVVFGGRTGNSRDRQVRKLMDLGFSRLPSLSVIRAPERDMLSDVVAMIEAPASNVQKWIAQTSDPKLPHPSLLAAQTITLSWQDVSARVDQASAASLQAVIEAPVTELNFTVIE